MACSRFFDKNQGLILPGLSDDISMQILARLPRISYSSTKSVSRSWKSAILNPKLYKVRKELKTTEEWLYILTTEKSEMLTWHAFDPVSKIWQRLPPMPNVGVEESREFPFRYNLRSISDIVRDWLQEKDIFNQMPFCGCAVGSADGSIYMIGGFYKAATMNCVFRYDPIFNKWNELNPMSIPRAYAKIGVVNGKLYIVGGLTKSRGDLHPLQSAERFDLCTGTWSKIPSMPNSKGQSLPTVFLGDYFEPIATGMSMYKGKLFVPQSLFSWPTFLDAGGEVYDPETNLWTEMPLGMREGWPAKEPGTKLSVIVDGNLYASDPSSFIHSAKIKIYDDKDDAWKVVHEDVPIRESAGSEAPFLLAGFLKKLHVITKDVSGNIVVIQSEKESDSSLVASTSSSPSGGSSNSVVDAAVWKVIASRSAGSGEPINCLTLDI